MAGDISIRKIEVEDVELLRKVALKAYCDHYLHLWYDGGEWYIEKSFSVRQLTSELSNPNSVFYLAYYINEPVGFLKINTHAALEGEENKNALELERIYLKKEATGKGIGRELVQLTFKIAQENNKDIVWLKAMDTSNESIDFYKRMGFRTIGTYTLPHKPMKEELRGMVIMKKDL
jgi:diamine N-acetyltransferase